jgi:hypothetical protein
MEHEHTEHKKQVDQENVSLNKQSTILPTCEEKISHARNSSDASSSSDECQSI